MTPLLRVLLTAASLAAPTSLLAQSISGTVFEDINYGGGVGRSLAAANAVRAGSAALVSAARVELYNASGFVSSTTTSSTGQYTFSGIGNANYTVRVVNGTVNSSRAAGAALPIQTYIFGNGNLVGGAKPQMADAPATSGVGSTIPSSAQSLALVTGVSDKAVTGVDFGFNFSTIVNTNESGQGSLAQFIANANALGSAGLNQQGLPAGRNTSIFMISDGLEHPGLRLGLTNQLTGANGAKRALINLTTGLPILTSAGTNIDGTTQTVNVGNTNSLQLGTGGTVGVDKVALSKVEGPEVELSATGTSGNVVELNAADCTLRGMAIHGSANAVRSVGTNVLIEGNLIGTTAVAVAIPATAPVSSIGVQLVSPTGLMQNNIVGYNGNSGLNYSAGAGTAGFVFRNNEFVQNGQITAGGDGFSIGDAGVAGPVLIEGNLISLSNSSGIQFEIGKVSDNIVRNNTLKGNGTSGASTRLEGSGIHYLARNAAVNSTNTDLITRNIITENQSSGVVINYGQRNVRISQNSIFLNGNNSIPGAAGLLSIDFTGPNGYVGGDSNYGQGDGVTPNDGLLDNGSYATIPPVRQGNGGIDYPIITEISKVGGKLRVKGYVGSASGQSRFGGAIVEIFSANNADTNQNGPTTTDPGSPVVAHGEAQNYVNTTTADANGNFEATFDNVVTTINSGDIVTATAYLPGYGTSECGVNLISSFQVLPVQLAKFTAQAEGSQVRLNWETATELHNDRFEVERSLDARNFAVVSTVAGRGTTSQGQRYTLLDTPPAAALLYYRLRQVDTDGTDTYSAMQTVRFDGAAGFLTFSPNPTANSTELNLSQLPAGAYRLTLHDLRGRLVQTNTAPGGQPYTLNLRAVPAGVYVLTVKGAGQTYTQRLVKTE